MWGKIKEIGFTLNAVGMFSGSLAVFLLMAIKGTAVVSDYTWILYAEIIWAGVSVLWGIERLVKDIRNGR